MRRNVLYTLGRPEAELDAIRSLIAERSGLDTTGLHIYSPTARREYGRVYYAVVDAETETGLLFVIGRRKDPSMVYPPQCFSEWEIKDLFTLANKKLGLWKFRMLNSVQLWEDEIQALVAK